MMNNNQNSNKKIEFNGKLIRYTLKFIGRIILFGSVLILYIIDREWITEFLSKPFAFFGITPLHIVWGIFMCIMLFHLLPAKTQQRTMAWLKMKEDIYKPVDNYDELKLLKYVQDQNKKAWTVMLVWLSFNAFWAFLYLNDIIKESELFLLSAFYFLSDYICILIYCPFQSNIMKNKCCVNCRIYDWGHFMMFTPMLFIKNFFCWSLFFTSLVVLIKWEITYTKYPERFWEGSNQNLKCINCKDKTCQYKKQYQNI